MADPEYNFNNTPSMKAARAAIGPEEEEIPEDMPDATVVAPFEQPPTQFTEMVDLPVGGPTEMNIMPKGYVQAGEQPEIMQSPRAAEGGPGETVAEIQQTAETAPDAAAEAEEAAEAALGEDIDIDYAKRLLAMSEGGVIGELPPEVTRLLRNYIRMSTRMTEYEQASALSAKEME